MQFPIRTSEHIKDSNGWRALLNKTPQEWIIRDVTERDYGIDSYIEIIPPSGAVTGDLCSIQLKSSEKVKWVNDKAILSRVKKSTINYWMNLPVPVFLVLADINEKRVYYCPVKSFIRRHYAKFLNGGTKSLSFNFRKEFQFGNEIGDSIFKTLYFREKHFSQVITYMSDFLIHCKEYLEFIVFNQGRDCFLSVEPESEVMLIHIYRCCMFLAEFLNIEWKVQDLSEAYKKDRETWKNYSPSYSMHEMTFDILAKEIQPIFLEVVRKSKDIITKEEKDYWVKTNLPLFYMCEDLNIENLKKGLYIS